MLDAVVLRSLGLQQPRWDLRPCFYKGLVTRVIKLLQILQILQFPQLLQMVWTGWR
jgi:hypothetical protein